jgi:Mg2+/Co2+ transporter CorC
VVADLGRAGDGGSGDGDSKSSLWRSLRRFFDGGEADQSLRAHLEEVIDEHEDGEASQGDLQQTEREMLRNLLHFSEMDAADVCIPRGEIIALPIRRAGPRWSPPLPPMAIRACRSIAKRWMP